MCCFYCRSRTTLFPSYDLNSQWKVLFSHSWVTGWGICVYLVWLQSLSSMLWAPSWKMYSVYSTQEGKRPRCWFAALLNGLLIFSKFRASSMWGYYLLVLSTLDNAEIKAWPSKCGLQNVHHIGYWSCHTELVQRLYSRFACMDLSYRWWLLQK